MSSYHLVPVWMRSHPKPSVPGGGRVPVPVIEGFLAPRTNQGLGKWEIPTAALGARAVTQDRHLGWFTGKNGDKGAPYQ